MTIAIAAMNLMALLFKHLIFCIFSSKKAISFHLLNTLYNKNCVFARKKRLPF